MYVWHHLVKFTITWLSVWQVHFKKFVWNTRRFAVKWLILPLFKIVLQYMSRPPAPALSSTLFIKVYKHDLRSIRYHFWPNKVGCVFVPITALFDNFLEFSRIFNFLRNNWSLWWINVTSGSRKEGEGRNTWVNELLPIWNETVVSNIIKQNKSRETQFSVLVYQLNFFEPSDDATKFSLSNTKKSMIWAIAC